MKTSMIIAVMHTTVVKLKPETNSGFNFANFTALISQMLHCNCIHPLKLISYCAQYIAVV